MDKLNEIASLKSFKPESVPENSTSEHSKGGLYRDHLRKSRVKLLPVSNTCYTIVRERSEDFCQGECGENTEVWNRGGQVPEDADKEGSGGQVPSSNAFRDVISSL